MKVRLLIAAILAATAWAPQSVQIASAIYCYPGDPPAVYQACVNYNSGIGQQVNNQNQLNNIQSQINNTISQINAIDAMIASLRNQIAAQKALIAQTQAAIDELSRQIRFGEASLIRQKAHVSVREQLLNQRLRYVDSHGSLNYVQLVLTSNSINQLMNRMVGAQQVAASDRRLLVGMEEEHAQIAQANTDLDGQRGQVSALLKQQKEAEADLEKNLATEAAALAFERQLAAQLADQYNKVQAERAAIDAQVGAAGPAIQRRRHQGGRRQRRVRMAGAELRPQLHEPAVRMLELLPRGLRAQLPVPAQDPHRDRHRGAVWHPDRRR